MQSLTAHAAPQVFKCLHARRKSCTLVLLLSQAGFDLFSRAEQDGQTDAPQLEDRDFARRASAPVGGLLCLSAGALWRLWPLA